MSKLDTTVLSQRDGDRSVRRIKELLQQGCSYAEICETLNFEGYKTLRLKEWSSVSIRQLIYKLRHQLNTWYGLSARRAGLAIKALPVGSVA